MSRSKDPITFIANSVPVISVQDLDRMGLERVRPLNTLSSGTTMNWGGWVFFSNSLYGFETCALETSPSNTHSYTSHASYSVVAMTRRFSTYGKVKKHHSSMNTSMSPVNTPVKGRAKMMKRRRRKTNYQIRWSDPSALKQSLPQQRYFS